MSGPRAKLQIRIRRNGISDLDWHPNGNLARIAGAMRPNCKSESEETRFPTRMRIRSGNGNLGGLRSEMTVGCARHQFRLGCASGAEISPRNPGDAVNTLEFRDFAVEIPTRMRIRSGNDRGLSPPSFPTGVQPNFRSDRWQCLWLLCGLDACLFYMTSDGLHLVVIWFLYCFWFSASDANPSRKSRFFGFGFATWLSDKRMYRYTHRDIFRDTHRGRNRDMYVRICLRIYVYGFHLGA